MPDGKQHEDEGQDKKSAKHTKDDHLGVALRTVYDEALREDVPDEFKDLLGKLG